MNGKRLLLSFFVPQFKFCYSILKMPCEWCEFVCSSLIKCKLKTVDWVNEHQERVVPEVGGGGGFIESCFFTLQLYADKRDSNSTFLSFYSISADYVEIFKFHFIRNSPGKRNGWVHLYFYLCFCCFKCRKQLKMFHFTWTSFAPFFFVGFF